nr:MAG: capsid protein [Cressdnaviricota sp.]
MPYARRSRRRVRAPTRARQPRRQNARRRMRKSMRRVRRSRNAFSYLRPNPFSKLFFEYENNGISITANGQAIVYLYPMNPAPLTNSMSTPAAADVLYTGLEQYADFFNMGRNLDSKIKVTVFSLSSSGIVKMALTAVPYRTGGYTIAANAPSIIASYSQQQLLSWPGTRFTFVGNSDGSNSVKSLSMYRKSRNMMGVSNMKDDYSSAFSMSTSTSHSLWTYPNDIWYYAITLYNNSASASTVQMSVRLTSSFRFWGPYVIDQVALS